MITPLLTIGEAAIRLRISESMVRKIVRTGALRAAHFGRRILIDEPDLEAYKESTKTGRKSIQQAATKEAV